MNKDIAAIGQLKLWRQDPVRFVRDQFGAEPDGWQGNVLRALPVSPRLAMSACKGPGKSCVLAWIIWWFLAVYRDAQVMCLSITEDNLKDNLWKELAFWQSKSELLQRAFLFSAKRITSCDHPKTWWCSARAFARSADPEQQANTLAGFHAKHCMIVLDEVGDYPGGVVAAAEAIFANEDGVKRLVVAGNPVRVGGPLHQIVTRDAHLWHVTFISGDPDDPNRSPRISVEWARQEIAKWGRDNPWVMVNILGLFPPAGSDQLIGANVVLKAMANDVPELAYRSDAIVWGLDPARFGDDESVLAKRQGVICRRMRIWRNLNGTKLGDQVAMAIMEAEQKGEKPDCVFIDVGGVGSSAFDRLEALGWGDLVEPVDFGWSPDDARFLNKRCEMWWALKDWLEKRPACLPNDPVLQSELSAPRFEYKAVQKRTVFVLESKEKMRARGVPSPNRADALAVTFAGPVMPMAREPRDLVDRAAKYKAKVDYDPFKQDAR